LKKVFAALIFFCLTVFSFAQDLPKQRRVNICASLHSYDMNPHTAAFTAEAQLFTGLYEGLFSYDPVNLAPLPAICSSYKISRDKKRWTFSLRNDAKFSDGTLITAKDVKNSWISLLETANAPFASLLDCIEGASDFRNGKISAQDVRIDARDDFTVVVHLTEPAGHLPKILCHHAFSVVSENKNAYSGAFVLESYDGNEILIKKNEFYWDSENVKIPEIKISSERLKNELLEPFKKLLTLSSSVLMSHARITVEDDPSYCDSSIPACLSEFWVTRILREDFSFEGLILSDDIFMGALADNGFLSEDAAIRAIEAGVNIIMMSEKRFGSVAKILLKKASESQEFNQKIQKSVQKIIEYKIKGGLLELRQIDFDSDGKKLKVPAFKVVAADF